MSKAIFIDSNFFVGLSISADSLHRYSHDLFGVVAVKFDKLLISNYVLAEVVTVVGRKLGKDQALALARIMMSQNFELIRMEQRHDKLGLQILEATSHKIGFVDASIIATMKLEGCRHLVTFDEQLAKVAKKQRLKVYGVEG